MCCGERVVAKKCAYSGIGDRKQFVYENQQQQQTTFINRNRWLCVCVCVFVILMAASLPSPNFAVFSLFLPSQSVDSKTHFMPPDPTNIQLRIHATTTQLAQKFGLTVSFLCAHFMSDFLCVCVNAGHIYPHQMFGSLHFACIGERCRRR